MKLSIALAVPCVAMWPFLVTASAIPRYFRRSHMTRRGLNSSQVQQELGGQVSPETSIFGPSEPRYNEATARWDTFAVPVVQVVIEPGEESDIPTIVQYCNENSVDFLTYNRGHGSPKSLASFNGIQINMVNLRNITVNPHGQTAWFQGGVFDGQANSYLWDQGYVVPTGACDCVGMMGAGLGGGHGRLEGLYGMISDNFLQLNVVLANGTCIIVNGTSNSDLLWGMKGAGHNFGIVTSFEMSIYPRGPDTWHVRNYIWTGDQLEAVFTALNDLNGNGTTPVNMASNFGNFYVNTTITDSEPVIGWTFGYRGSATEAAPFLAPFDAIPSVYNDAEDVPYPGVAHAQKTGLQDSICGEGVERITTTAGLQIYNITAEMQIWNGFLARLSTNSSLALGGIILHEGYSTAAVDRISSSSSAYPFRADHHLMLFQGLLETNSSSSDTNFMWKWAREVKDAWNNGQPGRLPDAYVNYANGFEPVQQWYGHEEWRLHRLQALKAAYDPQNRFRFFNPIISV